MSDTIPVVVRIIGIPAQGAADGPAILEQVLVAGPAGPVNGSSGQVFIPDGVYRVDVSVQATPARAAPVTAADLVDELAARLCPHQHVEDES